MYKEKFAKEIQIGDSVLFSGNMCPIQVTGTAKYRENGKDIVSLHTVIGV